MKTAVVFAASIFVPEKLFVVHEFFDMFGQHFKDADFYIGLNYGSLTVQENIIKSYVPNVTFKRLENSSLYNNMDTSATQVAYKALKESGKSYDVYWFGHTKGGQNSRESIRGMYLEEFFRQREMVEGMFEKYPYLGSWGLRGNSISATGTKWKDYNVDAVIPICGNLKFPPFNYTHVNWSYIETMLALKGAPFEQFIHRLDDTFFNTKLNSWYCETVPGWIPSRQGFFPYVHRKKCFWEDRNCMLTDITREWIEENSLSHLTSYLTI
jgi:hypothetical protein